MIDFDLPARDKPTRKKLRKFLLSAAGQELEQEFEIIVFGDRASLISWAYKNYIELLDYVSKYSSYYYSSGGTFSVYPKFQHALKTESDKWYNSTYNTVMYLYQPYYYETVIVPILKRFQKQKAFL
jgi:hypothetical protein